MCHMSKGNKISSPSYEQRKQNLVAIKGLTYVFSSLLRSLYDRTQVRAISETQTDDVLHNHTNKVANCPSIRISTFSSVKDFLDLAPAAFRYRCIFLGHFQSNQK